ncbi:twitch domain-containing radical SAM protein [Aquihabitans daechungensis]|uniref:twitch domain-containing radical SAM protein n=1 Tax=Aquihabitans daechungensis TaxID=1052257 RepID=UPI003B9F427E
MPERRLLQALRPRRSARPDDPDLERYQETRRTPHRDSICNAPLTNLYLQADGTASPCWLYYPWRPPKWSPNRSLADIWTGPEMTKVRNALAEHRFIGRCSECEHDIRTGNEPLATAYDNDRPIGDWPTMLELELSNLCNLECVMCNGKLSSRIRKNREGLEPLDVPYDESFIDQVTELLPHLHELRINGGEPLMQPLVHLLGERVAEHRPDLRITIATNGTVMNRKVRKLMETCTLHFNISIDSLQAERYEGIRIHADFAKLMANTAEIHDYCRANDRTLCIMVNPMRENWEEMPEFIRWCNERDLPVWFNTIRNPAHLALHSLPRDELAQIVERYRSEVFPDPVTDMEHRNAGIFEQLTHQVETWRDEASIEQPSRGVPVTLRPRS